MNIKKSSKFQNFLDVFFYKMCRIRYGPIMLQVRDEWLFIDAYGQIYKIRYTGQHDIPLSISILEK